MHGQVSAFTRQSTSYRPDIDGLRAIAVLSVMAFHYGASFPWPLLPGGFTGVDVFFVISGFLITQGLVQDIQAGAFSILNFYDRRIRRILPALTIMLAVVLLAGKFLLMPGDYQSLSISAAASAFGASNFFFLNDTGYFDQTADLMPLIHTWSLAVEEQFYVVWPPLLFAIMAGRRRLDVAAIIGAIVIVGFGLSLIWFDSDPKSAFYMASPRAWELAIGAAIVFLPPLPRAIGEPATAIGVAVIAVGFRSISEASFPGAAALYPCIGAALVIWPRQEQSSTATWLGRLSPIGLISYSLYLWHWPLWVLYRIYINGDQPSANEAISLVAVSMMIAAFSYWFIERPFRRVKWPQSTTIFAGFAASLFIFCASMYVDSADGLPSRIPPNVTAMKSLDTMWSWKCPAPFPRQSQDCNIGQPWQSTDRRFVLWGDSHASHLAPLFDVTARRDGWAGALLTWCPAVLDDKLTAYKNDEPQYAAHCVNQRQTALATISNDPQIRTVFLTSSWARLVRTAINSDSPGLAHRIQLFREALDRLLSDLAPLHRRVVVVGDAPQWNRNPVPCAVAADTSLLRRKCAEPHTDRAFVDKFQGPMLEAIKAEVAKFPGVSFYDPTIPLCGNSQCIDRINGEFLYRDVSHLRRNLSEKTRDDLSRVLDLDSLLQ